MGTDEEGSKEKGPQEGKEGSTGRGSQEGEDSNRRGPQEGVPVGSPGEAEDGARAARNRRGGGGGGTLTIQSAAILLLITFLWGSGHSAGKIALRELDAGQLAVLRPGSAWLVLLVLLILSGRVTRAWREMRESGRLLLALGLLGYAGAGGSTVIALSLLPAGITSLLTSMSPLMLVLGNVVIARRPIKPLQVVGAIVGFLGVVVLSGGLESVGGLAGASLIGVPIALVSAVSWAAYTALVRRLGNRDALVTTTITSGFGTAAVALIAVPLHDWSHLTTLAPISWFATLWAGGVAIGFAYVLWSMVLRRLPPTSVLPFNYATPIFSLTLAWLVLGEPLTPRVLFGAAGVMAGVVLSQIDDLRTLGRGKVVSHAVSD